MTRAEFHKQIHSLTNQEGIQRDLGEIELRRARERSAKINIDRLHRNGNTNPTN